MAGDPKTMARRLTDARLAKGYQVDQIVEYLIARRMSSKQRPKKRDLWIGTARRWFSRGLESIPDEFHDDFTELCRILDIPSLDDLWRD
jgi:hypothetical protein